MNRWESTRKPARTGTRDLERYEENDHFKPQLAAASLEAGCSGQSGESHIHGSEAHHPSAKRSDRRGKPVRVGVTGPGTTQTVSVKWAFGAEASARHPPGQRHRARGEAVP